MNVTTAAPQCPAKYWRAYCQRNPERLLHVAGTPAARKRVEQWEEQLIAQMNRDDLPLATRAVAFRSVVELRAATAREVATFFAVDPQVVILGLSLLESAAHKATHSSPGPTAQDGTSRIRAA